MTVSCSRCQAWNINIAHRAGVESRRPARWSRQRRATHVEVAVHDFNRDANRLAQAMFVEHVRAGEQHDRSDASARARASR